jgi:succinate dehydrogenase hydrophobic anchor subunit
LEFEVMGNPFEQETKPTSAWLWQAFTGVALLILLGLHFVANHFIAKVLFLIVVTIHALLGVRAILIDFGLSERAEMRINGVLMWVGVATVCYGLWVTWVIIR